MMAWAMPLLALVLAGAMIAAAIAALTARSLFTMAVASAAAAAACAAAALALGAERGALGLALFGVGIAPVLLMAGMLLSARTARATRKGAPWASLAAGAAMVCALAFVAPELSAPRATLLASADLAPWLALVVFVAAAACLGMLGFGERGAIERPQERRR
jgi:hypothetical protein